MTLAKIFDDSVDSIVVAAAAALLLLLFIDMFVWSFSLLSFVRLNDIVTFSLFRLRAPFNSILFTVFWCDADTFPFIALFELFLPMSFLVITTLPLGIDGTFRSDSFEPFDLIEDD